MSDLIKFIMDIASEAGNNILHLRNNTSLDLQFKNGNEMVTTADMQADQLISSRIHKQFPQHHLISEESSPDIEHIAASDTPLWIVDPIDGTVNYAHGHRQSAVSIAHVNSGKIVAGVVYNPFTNEMFHAETGQGAYLNGQSISVSAEANPARALIATGFPYDKSSLQPLIDRLGRVLHACADIRRLGSAALDICWVADGRLDGFYESLSLWDFAAAQLIAIEAGARYGHFSEVPPGVPPAFYCNDILVANPSLYPKLQNILQAG